MKAIYLTLLSITFFASAQAQMVQGTIKINENSKAEISLSSNKIVNLYAAFRENKYRINFEFSATDVAKNSNGQQIILFVFNTIVKRDGKMIGNIKRALMPFFPGDMFMPAETFDFISILANLQNNSAETISEIPKGSYEIVLEAKPLGV